MDVTTQQCRLLKRATRQPERMQCGFSVPSRSLFWFCLKMFCGLLLQVYQWVGGMLLHSPDGMCTWPTWVHAHAQTHTQQCPPSPGCSLSGSTNQLETIRSAHPGEVAWWGGRETQWGQMCWACCPECACHGLWYRTGRPHMPHKHFPLASATLSIRRRQPWLSTLIR